MITKKVIGLGVFALLTGGILFITNQLKPATSTMDHSGHGMSHDEMMAVDGSFYTGDRISAGQTGGLAIK